MNGKKMVFLCLGLFLLALWAPGTQASTASLEYTLEFPSYFEHGVEDGMLSVNGLTLGGVLTGTPTRPGLFYQEQRFNGTIGAGWWAQFLKEEPGAYSSVTAYVYSNAWTRISVSQDGPLRFTDLSWSAKFVGADGESDLLETLNSMLDFEFLMSDFGGVFSGSPSGTSFNLTLPITWEPEYWDGIPEHGIMGYQGSGGSSVDVTLILSQTGQVEAVPLPGTLPLLGTGLSALAMWRRLKQSA